MKRFILFLVGLHLTLINLFAQIPNSGFEIWESYADEGDGNCVPATNVYEKPDFWRGSLPYDCQTNSFSIQKNNESYPNGTGQYSIRIQADPINGVGGVASTLDNSVGGWPPPPSFPLNYRPDSLYLYYKYLPYGGDTMLVSIFFYKNGVVIGNPVWGTTETNTNWIELAAPMSYYTSDIPDSATILLLTGAFVQHSESVLYADNLSFDGFVTTVSEETINDYSTDFYPNPASDIITLDIVNNSELIEVNIFNVAGKLVKSEVFNQDIKQVDISSLSNGIYVVSVKTNNLIENQKLIIQR